MSYVSEQLEKLKAKNPNEPEFIQAATEVLHHLSLYLRLILSIRRTQFSKESQSLSVLLCLEFLGLTITARYR